MATHSKEECERIALQGLTKVYGAEGARKRLYGTKRVGSISTGMNPMWLLLGLAIGLAAIGVVATLTILPTGASAGLISATTEIISFLALIGLGIAVGILSYAFNMGTGKR